MNFITAKSEEAGSCKELVGRTTTNEELGRSLGESSCISEVVPRFLEYLRVEESRTEGTLLRYRGCLEQLIGIIGDRPIGELDGEVIGLYKARLLAAGLSAVTIGGRLSCLRSMLRYLRDVRQVRVYDPEKIRRPKLPKREVEYLSKDEVQRLLQAIPTKRLMGFRDRALVEVLCSTGMRISEALAMDRNSIDWDAGEAQIVGKGNKERKVYFSPQALDALAQYLRRRWDAESALFVTHGNHPRRMQPAGMWKRLRRYGQVAGLKPNVYPHMLRHTMATTLLANGCPIGHIRVLLGHSQLATTCRYYLGVLSDREAKEAHAKYLSYESGAGKETQSNKTT